jgi:hypothetical protein
MSGGGVERRRQAVAAAVGLVIGAVVNVITGMLTQRWGLAWLLATVVCVVAGGGLLAWLTARATSAASDPAGPVRVSVYGDGAIGAGDSVTGSSTKVTRPPAEGPTRSGMPARHSDADEGVSASGPGSIAAGGDVRDSQTEVTGEEPES